MYKMILIDDEQNRVQAIKNLIDWKKYNIEVVGVAYNGTDGLNLFECLMPDIALVDIQMPYMNGLKVIESVREQNIQTEIIILSGFDNFEYAKQAIRWDVNNYLLKPCSMEEIIEAVCTAKDKFIEKDNQQRKLNSFYSLYMENQKLNRDKLLENLLNSQVDDSFGFFDEIEKYSIKLLDSTTCLAVFQHQTEDNDVKIDRIISQEMLDEFFSELKIPCVFEYLYHKGDLVLIMSQEHPEHDDFTQYANEVKLKLTSEFKENFIVGISQPCVSPILISQSYKKALAAIQHVTFFNPETIQETILRYETHVTDNGHNFHYPFNEEKDILEALEAGDKEKCKTSFDNFFIKLQKNFQSDINSFIGLINTLVGSIYRHCLKKNMDVTSLDMIISNSYDSLTTAKSLDLLKNIIYSMLMTIIENTNVKSEENLFIQKALDFIHNHATENIGLQTLADELFITPAYFSHLFKQEMNINFVDYLNQYRINMAKELLADVRLKNYQVAYQVGYQDEKYFYKLFKKTTGVTASQYRASLK